MNHPIEQRNQDDIYIGICFAMVKLKDIQVKECRLLCNVVALQTVHFN